jgi:hypothetical protein
MLIGREMKRAIKVGKASQGAAPGGVTTSHTMSTTTTGARTVAMNLHIRMYLLHEHGRFLHDHEIADREILRAVGCFGRA